MYGGGSAEGPRGSAERPEAQLALPLVTTPPDIRKWLSFPGGPEGGPRRGAPPHVGRPAPGCLAQPSTDPSPDIPRGGGLQKGPRPHFPFNVLCLHRDDLPFLLRLALCTQAPTSTM